MIITVKETVRRMLLQYPMLFKNKSDCFEHLFLTNGNGYDWEDGCLVDRCKDENDVSPHWADESGAPRHGEYTPMDPMIEEMLRKHRILDARRENAQINFVLANFDAMFDEPVRFVDPYPVCEYSDLFHMPDDVQPDWQEACYQSAMALQYYLNSYREPPIEDMRARNRAFLHSRFADRVARMAEIAQAVLAKKD